MRKKKKESVKTVSLRIGQELLDKIDELSETEDRSRNSMMNILLKNSIAQIKKN